MGIRSKFSFLSDRLLGRTKIQDVSATVVIEKGTARVKPFKFQFLGGIVGGGIRLKPLEKGVALASAFKVEGLDVGAAAEKLHLKHPLTGKASVEADLEGHGRSAAELIERLKGEVTLSVRDGTVAHHYLESLDLLPDTFFAGQPPLKSIS
ncbi:MAG: AsmA family protein [Desulfobacter sp.]